MKVIASAVSNVASNMSPASAAGPAIGAQHVAGDGEQDDPAQRADGRCDQEGSSGNRSTPAGRATIDAHRRDQLARKVMPNGRR